MLTISDIKKIQDIIESIKQRQDVSLPTKICFVAIAQKLIDQWSKDQIAILMKQNLDQPLKQLRKTFDQITKDLSK